MLITLPNLPVLFQDVLWTLAIPQQKNRSEFTSRTQIVGQPGAEQWTATVQALAPVNDAEERAWHAFLALCRGAENSFYLPARPRVQTTAAAPTVTAAVAGNAAVTLSSVANVAPGMWATVRQANGHRRLVKITAIAGSNIQFEPALTGAPSIGVTLDIADPYALVRMADNRRPLPTIGRAFEFAVEEAL